MNPDLIHFCYCLGVSILNEEANVRLIRKITGSADYSGNKIILVSRLGRVYGISEPIAQDFIDHLPKAAYMSQREIMSNLGREWIEFFADSNPPKSLVENISDRLALPQKRVMKILEQVEASSAP
jgi:hypothetical protein